MRIRSQLILALVAALGFVAAVTASLVIVSERGEAMLQAQQGSQEIARDVANLLILTQELTLYAGPRPAAQWRTRHAHLRLSIADPAAAATASSPALAALDQQALQLAGLFSPLLDAMAPEPTPFTERRRSLLLERLLAETQELVELRYSWARSVGDEQARQQRQLALAAVVGPGLLLLICLALGWLVVRRVLIPLSRLEAVSAAIQRGGLTVRVDSSEQDELGDASRAVDAMAASLLSANAELQQEVEQRRVVQAQLRLVIDRVPALIAHLDADHRYRLVNRAYLEWDRRQRGDIVGHTVADVHGRRNASQMEPYLARALAGETITFEATVLRDGDPRVLRVTYVPERDAAGRVHSVFALKTDVTAERRAQARLRVVMDASPLGLFTTDNDGRCDYVNSALERITGITAAEALGLGLYRALHPDVGARLASHDLSVRFQAAIQTREHRHLLADGNPAWLRSNLTLLHQGGVPDGHVGTIEDVTERHAMDEALTERTAALLHSNEDLARFAYLASHDLQEPVRMVNSYGQLLLRRHRDQLPAEAVDFVTYMVEGAQRALALIRDVLSMARLDSPARPMAPVSLDGVLVQSLRDLHEAIQDSAAGVTFGPLPTVMGEHRQWVQVLSNLVGNAIKFRGASAPRVHVAAEREPGLWRISVSDNGIGIDPQYTDRIFVMFQRLNPRQDYAGTGIGLAVCKRAVERLGGSIEVRSQPGQGSTFTLLLPDRGDSRIVVAADGVVPA